MDTFVNLPATFPDGPGGKRCRLEKRRSKRRAARTPAWSMGVVKDIMVVPVVLLFIRSERKPLLWRLLAYIVFFSFCVDRVQRLTFHAFRMCRTMTRFEPQILLFGLGSAVIG